MIDIMRWSRAGSSTSIAPDRLQTETFNLYLRGTAREFKRESRYPRIGWGNRGYREWQHDEARGLLLRTTARARHSPRECTRCPVTATGTALLIGSLNSPSRRRARSATTVARPHVVQLVSSSQTTKLRHPLFNKRKSRRPRVPPNDPRSDLLYIVETH